MSRHYVTPEEDVSERARPPRGTRARHLVTVVVVLLVWLGIGAVGGPTVGRLSQAQQNNSTTFLPSTAESTEVATLAAGFTDTTAVPYFVVITRPSGLQPADRQAVQQFIAGIPALTFPVDRTRTLGSYLASPPAAAIPSKDAAALLVPVLLDGNKASEVVGGSQSPIYEGALALRASAKALLAPSGLQVYVTGPGGLLADFVTAFGGIDGILLGVALAVVFLILLVVYRSPILPFAVLLTALFGLSLAALVIYPLAKNGTIALNGQSQGILSILVVGAATDYALLLVSRYREELHDHPSKWAAMGVAWRAAVQPIAASAATVILGLLCLLLSQLGSTHGLGPVGAIGIAGALVAATTFLPAVLLLFGRRIFWPLIPRIDHVHAEDSVGIRGLWGQVAGVVGRHPRRTWVITLVALLACAVFLPTFKASGTTQAELFRNPVESVVGQRVLARHFPAGSGTPVQVIAPEAAAGQVVARMGQVSGVVDPAVVTDAPAGAPAGGGSGGTGGGGSGGTGGSPAGSTPKVVDGRVLVQATLLPAPDSPQAEQVVQQLRTELHPIDAGVLVGGTTAASLDLRLASDRDLRVIIPTILLVILVVLMVLLRSLVAAVLLVVANVVSFAATIGVSALVFNHLFNFPGADPAIPLYAFVFLVALGIDYSIFLMTRVREESGPRGTRAGVLVGLAVTGGVITSAGVVLASTFSALSVIPILFLAQIAFIVAFGVLLDTLVVRSLLVPALCHDIGSAIWWPGRLDRPLGRHAKGRRPTTREQRR